MSADKYASDKLTVKPLEGCADYQFWSRNARAYLTRYDPLLLGLKPEAQGTSNVAINKWREASAQAKGTLTLLLSEQVQVRAIAILEDDDRTAHELWEFLRSTYTKSNEQAIQNLRVKLDKLVYVEGTDWDEHLNQFNSLIAQLSVQNVEIDDAQKKSMLIRTLPESMSVISTVVSAQAGMSLESLDALIRAELDRKNNPYNPQGKGKDMKANFVKHGRPGPSRQGPHVQKKIGKCHYCGKPGHYKRECRKFKAWQDKKDKRNRQGNRPQRGRGNGQGNWNGNGNNNPNNRGQGNNQPNFGNNQQIDIQNMLSTLQALFCSKSADVATQIRTASSTTTFWRIHG